MATKKPESATDKSTEPTADKPTAATATKQASGKYRPKINWRYGRLYREGETYDMAESKIPQAELDAAVEAGYLEVV